MNKETGAKDWKTFSNWERAYKKKVLKALTIDSAFAIFIDLWNVQTGFPTNEIELFRKRKLDELLKLRKSFDLIQKRINA